MEFFNDDIIDILKQRLNIAVNRSEYALSAKGTEEMMKCLNLSLSTGKMIGKLVYI